VPGEDGELRDLRLSSKTLLEGLQIISFQDSENRCGRCMFKSRQALSESALSKFVNNGLGDTDTSCSRHA
jgi:hypothetical protein